ncbi:MAG: DUF4097 domain-containing protein [Gemmatimonadota bacterium]
MLINLAAALTATLALAQQTDTTFSVPPNGRLSLHNVAGLVDIHTWKREAVRARVDHGSRDRVDVLTSGSTVTLEVESRYGGPSVANFDLTIPRSMAIEIHGVEVTVSLDGVGADVSVQSVEGSIDVRGGNGLVSLQSVDGDITLEGARGKISVNAVDGYVEIRDVEGDINVQGVDGDITLERVDSGNVDVATVEGDILYDGTIQDGGRYFLSTHDGDLRVAVTGRVNARVSVATFDGEFSAPCPIRFDGPIDSKRFSFTLGTGKALVELESFDGLIELVQPAGSCP